MEKIFKKVAEWLLAHGYPLNCIWKKEGKWPCEHCRGLVAFSEVHPDHILSRLMLI